MSGPKSMEPSRGCRVERAEIEFVGWYAMGGCLNGARCGQVGVVWVCGVASEMGAEPGRLMLSDRSLGVKVEWS